MTPDALPAVALARVPAGAFERRTWESAHLTRTEASLVGARAAEKRRSEFVAGRVAAKAAAALLLGRRWDLGDIAVLRERGETTGPPRLTVAGACPCEISISHADGVAVAAASRDRVGIDLVAVEPQGPAFATDAFAPGELEAWREWLGSVAAADEVIAIAFAAKEAALKWMRTGLTVPLHRVIVQPRDAHAASVPPPVLRLLNVDPRWRASLLQVPQTRLRVCVQDAARRTGSGLAARILHLGHRIVFVLWGADGAPRGD